MMTTINNIALGVAGLIILICLLSNVFNIFSYGISLFMFLLPSVLIRYWYICLIPTYIALIPTLWKHDPSYLLWSLPYCMIWALIFTIIKANE